MLLMKDAMLLMKEAILVDERSSGAGDDLLRKTKTGETGVFRVLSRRVEVGVLQLTENQAILLQGRHSGLIISH